MKKISWCKKQGKGIKLLAPNDNLSEEYYQNAEESLSKLNGDRITKIRKLLSKF